MYAAAGVPEYWVLHLFRRILVVQAFRGRLSLDPTINGKRHGVARNRNESVGVGQLMPAE
jgi:hypothetical protein